MELTLALMATIAGLIYYFSLTFRVRNAWKTVAREMNLDFHNSFWLPYIKVEGDYQGFHILIKYLPRDESTWESGSYTSRKKSNTRYWTRFIVQPRRHRIPMDLNLSHPQDQQLKALHGSIQYPTDYGPYYFQITTFHAWKYKHFTNANKMIKQLHLMMHWAQEIRQEPAQPLALS